MRTITILLLTATVTALSSCSKKNSASGPINLPGNATAYVAGYVGDTAVYFVNGKKYALTSGKTPASANSIALAGSDVYTAGYESNGAHTVAKYWKNGVATVLSDTTLNAVATAIAVTDSNVYVAGWVSLGSTNAAVLWKNGILTNLTATGHNGAANALCINGTDVYVAGYDSIAGQASACYWKNGSINTLPDSRSYAVAQGITVNGSDVYIVGRDMNLIDTSYYMGPRVWKNGSVVELPTTSRYALATSITIVGNTVYIGGVDQNQGVYWENGAENPISDGYWTSAIAVNNGDIYCAGLSSSSGSAGYNSATFWRNGIGFILDANNSTANAIVVTN